MTRVRVCRQSPVPRQERRPKWCQSWMQPGNLQMGRAELGDVCSSTDSPVQLYRLGFRGKPHWTGAPVERLAAQVVCAMQETWQPMNPHIPLTRRRVSWGSEWRGIGPAEQGGTGQLMSIESDWHS